MTLAFLVACACVYLDYRSVLAWVLHPMHVFLEYVMWFLLHAVQQRM